MDTQHEHRLAATNCDLFDGRIPASPGVCEVCDARHVAAREEAEFVDILRRYAEQTSDGSGRSATVERYIAEHDGAPVSEFVHWMRRAKKAEAAERSLSRELSRIPRWVRALF